MVAGDLEKVGFGSLAGSNPLKPKGKPFRKLLVPKCLVETDVCVSGGFCLGSIPAGGHSRERSLLLLLRFVCRLPCWLVGLLLAFLPFLSLSALLVFFISLNSYLSETSSLGPQEHCGCHGNISSHPARSGILSQTGGKATI